MSDYLEWMHDFWRIFFRRQQLLVLFLPQHNQQLLLVLGQEIHQYLQVPLMLFNSTLQQQELLGHNLVPAV